MLVQISARDHVVESSPIDGDGNLGSRLEVCRRAGGYSAHVAWLPALCGSRRILPLSDMYTAVYSM